MKSVQLLHLFISLVAAGAATLYIFDDECVPPVARRGITQRGSMTAIQVQNDGECIHTPFAYKGLEVIAADKGILDGRSQLQFHVSKDCSGQFDFISDIAISNSSCLFDSNGVLFNAVKIVKTSQE